MGKVNDSRLFDKRKAFFLFDSDTLDRVQTGFYGFTIDDGLFIERLEDLKDQSTLLSCDASSIRANGTRLKGWPLGVGCYTLIKREFNKIQITQDFMGSYGIYLYQDGDYFALSNSFLYLVEYIEKTTHKISINRDYANYFLVAGFCSMAYSQTMVNEIQLLDRSAVVEINVTNRRFSLHYLDYEENSIDINSRGGVALLDDWYDRWTGFIKNLKSQNENIRIDLSGGFDSRLTLLLMLGADIDLNEIYIRSYEDKRHTHEEDMEIAKEISDFYRFSLNNTNNIHDQYVNYVMDDILDISYYTRLGFSKEMYYRNRFMLSKLHHFGGAGGECIRSYWDMSESEYTEQMIRRCRQFPYPQKLEHSVRTLLSLAFENIKEKFANLGRSIKSQDVMLNLYREIRGRNHFAKGAAEGYLAGGIGQCPLLDPQLHKLRLNDNNCNDKNLLIAVIFDRYQKKLLDFRFEGKRCINEQTVKYAEKINQRFPRSMGARQEARVVQLLNQATAKASALPKTPSIPLAKINKHVEGIFFSRRLKGIFLSLYDEEVYAQIAHSIKNNNLQAHVAIAIAAILQCVYTNETLNQGLSKFTNPLDLDNYDTKKLKRHPYLDNYITARIDIKNRATNIGPNGDTNNIQIIEITDRDARINISSWFPNNGKGYVIESKAGHLMVSFKCIHAGKLSIILRSKYILGKDGARIPFWIDYYSMTYNSELVFDTTKPVWHDVPFSFNRSVEDGEIITLCIEWGPHMF